MARSGDTFRTVVCGVVSICLVASYAPEYSLQLLLDASTKEVVGVVAFVLAPSAYLIGLVLMTVGIICLKESSYYAPEGGLRSRNLVRHFVRRSTVILLAEGYWPYWNASVQALVRRCYKLIIKDLLLDDERVPRWLADRVHSVPLIESGLSAKVEYLEQEVRFYYSLAFVVFVLGFVGGAGVHLYRYGFFGYFYTSHSENWHVYTSSVAIFIVIVLRMRCAYLLNLHHAVVMEAKIIWLLQREREKK